MSTPPIPPSNLADAGTPTPTTPGSSEGATPPPSALAVSEQATTIPFALPLSENATQPESGGPAEPPPSLAAIPGYELLSELGRGGMGVVYKARQTKLNRLVALKMILAGGHAGAADLARFQTEAEAIARLQHPNIVQVHEVGEHEGKPFFSLEFCAGGSLARKLGGTPLPTGEAAKLVETLARAMQEAHARHVIHRDLKPANVLLLEDGTPKVTDFGLAKKLDEAGQTQSGAVMGTPSYMAPEQAGGQTSDIGPLADVYALGAILYECLTGRPPFKAATAVDTLLQVVSDEPVPPTQLQSKVPRDLETICLKCLQKEPRKRYASAREMADDLRRFLNNEPIRARPVGRVERGWRWCRRNPAVAALLGLLLLVFAAGATISTTLAVVADRRADDATRAKAQAEQEAGNARKEKADAIDARNELRKSNDRLLTSLAQSKLRPLAAQAAKPGEALPPLTDPEVEALWELASAPEEELRLRFVEEALRTPATTRQLLDRAEVALQAAVGLDATRRARVQRLLAERMQAPATPEQEQGRIALLLARMGVRDPAVAGKVGRTLTQVISTAKEPNALTSLAAGLSTAEGRMEPKEAVTVLTQAMRTTKEPGALRSLAEALSRAAGRLERNEAAVVCGQAAAVLTQDMKAPQDAVALEHLAEGLSALAVRMEPQEAATALLQAAAILTQAMRTPKYPTELQHLTQGLSALAGTMGPKEAAQSAAALMEAMKSANVGPYEAGHLAKGLSAVVERMEPKEAAVVRGQAVIVLTKVLRKWKDFSIALNDLAAGLSALAARLEPKEAAECAGAITQIMRTTKEPFALMAMAHALSAVAGRMESKEAAAACSQAAIALIQVISTTTESNALGILAGGLSALAVQMEPKEATKCAATLIQTMRTTKEQGALMFLAHCLSVVAARLEPKEAVTVLTQVIEVSGTTKEPIASMYLAESFSALAARLEPKEAVTALTRALRTTKEPGALRVLAEGLVAMASRLESKEAAECAAALTEAMGTAEEPGTQQSLAKGLSAVARRLEPKEATAVCRQAAAALTQAIAETKEPDELGELAGGLSAVAEQLELKEATAVCRQPAVTLTQVMRTTKEPHALAALAQGKSAIAKWLEPKEAAECAAALTQAMSQTNDDLELTPLAHGLSAVADRLEPRQAAATLTAAMSKAKNSEALASLAQVLVAVVGRMEPREGAAVCGPAAATLIQAMSTTNEPKVIQHSTKGRMVLWYSAEGLSTVLSREQTANFARRPRGVASTVAALGGPGPPLTTPGLLAPALEPLPPPLPAQTLVELLKHPLCVGEARRLVLWQLSRHYERPFADQWEFVEYARLHQLDLDLTSPTQKPEPAVALPPR
jgi:hypothetical protein